MLFFIEKYLKPLESIITLFGSILLLGSKFVKWFMKIRLKYGIIDIPYANEIHYYIEIYPCFIKRFSSFFQKRKIKIELLFQPIYLQISDFEIIVRDFVETIGSEHLQKIKIIEKNENNSKRLYFEVDSNKVYRIIINSKGGIVGNTVQVLYHLEIKSSDSIII